MNKVRNTAFSINCYNFAPMQKNCNDYKFSLFKDAPILKIMGA